MQTEILLLEDDESLQRAVSFKLAREGYRVFTAGDIKTALPLYEDHHMPFILCDINLPDGSGLDFCRLIRRQSDVYFLFLTSCDTEQDIINGYDAGADDYIVKPFSLTVLVSKVNALRNRHFPDNRKSSILSSSIEYFPEENRVKKDGAYLTLTANEYKLLSCFLRHPMQVLSRNQLLEAVWDIDGNFVDENTLAVNIRRLREKIEDDPAHPVYLKNMRGLGYIWDRTCKKE